MGRLGQLFRSYRTFYKITNKEENHNRYEFHDGLNVDTKEWSTETCARGGIYFIRKKDILHWLQYNHIIGYWIREVRIPRDEKLISYEEGKIKAHSVILGERKKIDLDLIKKLSRKCSLLSHKDEVVNWAISTTNLEVLKYLEVSSHFIHMIDWYDVISNSVKNNDAEALDYAMHKDTFEKVHDTENLVKLLNEAAERGSIDVVFYLLSIIPKDSKCRASLSIVRNSIKMNNMEVIDKALELGLINIDNINHTGDIGEIICEKGNTFTIDYFVKKGYNFKKVPYDKFETAAIFNNTDMMNYLVSSKIVDLEVSLRNGDVVKSIIDNDSIGAMRYLLSKGMHSKFSNPEFLIRAFRARAVKVLKCLIETGCITAKTFNLDIELNSAIRYSLNSNLYGATISYLIDNGFKLKTEQILKTAIYYNASDIVEYLLKNNIVNIKALNDTSIYLTIERDVNSCSYRSRELCFILHKYGYTKGLAMKAKAKLNSKNKKKKKKKGKR